MASQLVSGKIAFVTGAGSGIGRAVCQVLAREGAKVIATDANGKAASETVQHLPGGTGSHHAIALDVSVKNNVIESVKNTIQHCGGAPSIVVNCAGITRDNFLLKLDEKSFDDVINVNLKGTFLVVQATAQAMVESNIRNGSIVNIASIVGKHGNIGQANYTASKAGVEALTKTAAKEFGKFGIRVNTVVPGFIISPMTETIPEAVKKMFLAGIALGRFGRPEEVAEVIAFLSSDKSSYINGASIDVIGG